MLSVDYAAIIDVDADRVWSVLSRFGEIAVWHPRLRPSAAPR